MALSRTRVYLSSIDGLFITFDQYSGVVDLLHSFSDNASIILELIQLVLVYQMARNNALTMLRQRWA